MKIYRIRRKSDGKFFTNFSYGLYPTFTGEGAFFRKIDTIKNHLENLMWDYDWNPERIYPSYGEWHLNRLVQTEHHPERVNNFEVVVNDITINGEEILQAVDIIELSALPSVEEVDD